VGLWTWGIDWLGLGAPTGAKIIFTSVLQIVGTVSAAFIAIWLSLLLRGEWKLWIERRH
jgi:hypothetical protein